jgi:hypothetical protein
MSDPDVRTVGESEAAPYRSVRELRAANSRLLALLAEKGEITPFLERVETFIERGRATGAILDAEQERWDSQRILDYWATRLYRATYRPDREPIDATIAEFNPQLGQKLEDDLCPYVGLSAFQEENAPDFHGRTQLVKDMITRLARRRFLVVVGPSGSGKSSIVRAGILPRLKSGELEGSSDWHYFPRPMVPGSAPLLNLARLILPGDDLAAAAAAESEAESFMKDSGHLLKRLDSFEKKPSVLFIDQFEEIFTLCEDVRARKALTDNLLEVIRAPESRHMIILTMRIDYETFVTRLETFYQFFREAEERVPPLEADELREAIELPAERVKLEFEEGVVSYLVQDILGEPAALPLLQFTLRELWNRRRYNRVTMEAYEELGGGRLALARTADKLFNSLPPEDQQVVKSIFLRMVRPGVGLEVTSNRVSRELLFQDYAPDRVGRVLKRLVSDGLVRMTPGDSPDDDQFEVAHEALARNWPTMVDWIDNDRPAIARRRQMELKVLEWVRLGRGESGLLDAVQLAEAKHWLESPDASRLGFDKALPDLVKASARALDREKRRLHAWIGALAILLLLTVAAAGFAYLKWLQAEKNYSDYVEANARAIAEAERLKQQIEETQTERERLEQYQQSKSQPTLQAEERVGGSLEYTPQLWENGSTLRISFLDGDPQVQQKVKQVAALWTEHANLKFEFVAAREGDIRISFKHPGSWSMLGKAALEAPKNQPTMNFGWLLPSTPAEEYSRIVLREFGFALGLIPEHQNPNAEIPWNIERVYAYFSGPPNNWTRDDVNRNILDKYSRQSLPDYRPFDKQSVMLFPIAKELTLGGFEVGVNSKLSESDKSFIARLYPK